MPIYEYRCEACGHQQEYLQKVNDPPRTVCGSCGKPALAKMLTAAGFQLKGSGWYATDFKNKGSAPVKADTKTDTKKDGAAASESKPAGDSKSEGGSKDSAPSPGAGSSASGS